MVKKRLTGKEKTVLWGLSRYPSYNTRQLSNVIGINQSTITTAINRLKNAGYYNTLRVPDIRCLGEELIIISFGPFKPSPEHSTETVISQRPKIFYTLSKPTHALSITTSRNYSEFKKELARYRVSIERKSMIQEHDLKHILFPLPHCEFLKLLDYSTILANEFDIPDELSSDLDEVPQRPPPRNYSFSTTEKKVFMGLIKFPDASDRVVADHTSISRSRVTTLREKFEKLGLLRTVTNINLSKLGYNLQSFSFMKLRPRNMSEWDGVSQTVPENGLNNYFAISDRIDRVEIGAYKDYQDFEQRWSHVMHQKEFQDMVEDDPVHLLFPSSEVSSPICPSYAKLVEDVFNIQGVDSPKS